MSAKTRINRPTTATPRNVGTRRYLHVSTDYRWIGNGKEPARFVKVGRGSTFRKEV